MPWVAVDEDGSESISSDKPHRKYNSWSNESSDYSEGHFDQVYLSEGSIKKLLGHCLTWKDEPQEI